MNNFISNRGESPMSGEANLLISSCAKSKARLTLRRKSVGFPDWNAPQVISLNPRMSA